jgi:hypothetical protein
MGCGIKAMYEEEEDRRRLLEEEKTQILLNKYSQKTPLQILTFVLELRESYNNLMETNPALTKSSFEWLDKIDRCINDFREH